MGPRREGRSGLSEKRLPCSLRALLRPSSSTPARSPDRRASKFLSGGRLFPLARSANERGVHELEQALGPCRPRTGLAEIWAGLRGRAFDALYLAGPAPDLGGLKPAFLLCQDTHWNRNAERADVVLPAAAFAETGGTWVNTEGRVRTYAPALPRPGSALPDGAILASLAERMGVPGFGRRDHAAALRAIRERVAALSAYESAGAGKDFVLPEAPAGALRFVPVAPPLRRRGRRPAAKAGAGPALSGEVLRGFDLVAGNRSYARTKRSR